MPTMPTMPTTLFTKGDVRAAGNCLQLFLAENSWVLRDLLEERLARQGTLLKGAGLDRWLRDAGKLNRLLLDGDWLGQAGLDHLLGHTKLGGLTDKFFLEGGWEARAALEPSLPM